jgi:c-di-GMP-binding flagellar brake protein YcgR
MPQLFAAKVQEAKERRAARRAPIIVRVECRTPRILAQGNAENISETGMLITCREALEVSQAVTLRFALPVAPQKSVAVSTGAVVVRMERRRFMGVRFLGLRPAFREAIALYIERTGALAPRALEALPDKK